MSAKQLVRRLLGPLVRPVIHEVDAHLDARVATLLAHTQALSHRLEFLRKEILFELRYSQAAARPDTGAEGSIVSPEKLAAMGGDVRINIGAGHLSRPEYMNVDARPLDGIDVVADVRSLPFEKESIAELFSAHVLEHFPVEELRRVLLPYWVSLLRPGGKFVAVVPDFETMVAEFVAGRLGFEELREVTYGSQEYDGDFHFNGFSQASIQSLLEGAGLRDVVVRVSGRRNGMCYEMEVAGVRPPVDSTAAPGDR